MIKSVSLNSVLIIPDGVQEESAGGIKIPELARENEMKRTNRGKVALVGKNVLWPEVGDYVSFYRHAAVEVKEDGIGYLLVNDSRHVLVTLSTEE